MKKNYFLAILMMTMVLSGCFGNEAIEENEDPVDDQLPNTGEELDDWNVHLAATSGDLPACDTVTNGRLYYVEDDGNFQVCKTSGWEVIEISGADGADGTDGENGSDGQNGETPMFNVTASTTCPDGGKRVAIGEDLDEDGILDNVEATTFLDICDGIDGADGQDGEDGIDGQDGADGINGQDGQDGADGTSVNIVGSVPAVADLPSNYQGNVGDGYIVSNSGHLHIWDGSSWVDAGNITGPEGPSGVNGTDGAAGVNGTDGQDGVDGLSALVTISSEPSGTNCANGGTKIEVGIDDDSDGVLDTSEIDQTQYVCDGSSSSGAGSTNQTMLTSIGTPPGTMNCEAGGRIISHGLDNGDGGGTAANGLLESGEIDASTTYCSTFIIMDEFKMVKDIRTGSNNGSGANSFAVLGNTIYFVADDGIHGGEVWKTDGTAAGTQLVLDIYTGSGSSYSSSLISDGNMLYFTARTLGSNVFGLWGSDGTANGTTLLSNSFNNWAQPSELTVVGSSLFFSATNGSGSELWVSNGTAAGTFMVKNINSGGGSSSPSGLVALGNEVYFAANDGTNGEELWKSNGTTAGTVLVKDINSGGGNSDIDWLTAMGSQVFFEASDGNNGRELWKSNGTSSGTLMVKDIHDSGNNFGSSDPSNLVVMNNTLFFSAQDGSNWTELWKSDGTASGTLMVKDINSGTGSSSPSHFAVAGSVLFFKADDGTYGTELWKTDGTTAGTLMVKDINNGSSNHCNWNVSSTHTCDMFSVGDSIYFAADDGLGYGYELWTSDGTSTGTVMVQDINPGSGSSSLTFFIPAGDYLFLRATDGTYGDEIWSNKGLFTEITYS